MSSPSTNERSGPREKAAPNLSELQGQDATPASLASITRQIVTLRHRFRNLNWSGRVKFIGIVIQLVPQIALPLARLAINSIRVARALRALKIADEKRRLDRRWKP